MSVSCHFLAVCADCSVVTAPWSSIQQLLLAFNKAYKICQVGKLKLQLLTCYLLAGVVSRLCSLQQAALKGLVACRRAGTEAALGAMP